MAGTYFYIDTDGERDNEDLKFSRAMNKEKSEKKKNDNKKDKKKTKK